MIEPYDREVEGELMDAAKTIKLTGRCPACYKPVPVTYEVKQVFRETATGKVFTYWMYTSIHEEYPVHEECQAAFVNIRRVRQGFQGSGS